MNCAVCDTDSSDLRTFRGECVGGFGVGLRPNVGTLDGRFRPEITGSKPSIRSIEAGYVWDSTHLGWADPVPTLSRYRR